MKSLESVAGRGLRLKKSRPHAMHGRHMTQSRLLLPVQKLNYNFSLDINIYITKKNDNLQNIFNKQDYLFIHKK